MNCNDVAEVEERSDFQCHCGRFSSLGHSGFKSKYGYSYSDAVPEPKQAWLRVTRVTKAEHAKQSAVLTLSDRKIS